MKKIILLLMLTSLGLSACSDSEQKTQEETVSSESLNSEEMAEDTSEKEITEAKQENLDDDNDDRKEISEGTDLEESSEESESSQAGQVKSAIQIAAEDLGAKPEDLVVLVNDADDDDDDSEDEVKLAFFYEGTIYKYEIENSRIDGREEIKNVEKDLVDELLRGEEALNIALKDSGLEGTYQGKYSIDIDEEDGKIIYEIKIYKDNEDIEYEIDARTGEILEKDI